MSDIHVVVDELVSPTPHLSGMIVDPVKAKTTIQSVLKIVQGVSAILGPLVGNPTLAAQVATFEALATQDWVVSLIVGLLAIPDHLKPAAAASIQAQLKTFVPPTSA